MNAENNPGLPLITHTGFAQHTADSPRMSQHMLVKVYQCLMSRYAAIHLAHMQPRHNTTLKRRREDDVENDAEGILQPHGVSQSNDEEDADEVEMMLEGAAHVD